MGNLYDDLFNDFFKTNTFISIRELHLSQLDNNSTVDLKTSRRTLKRNADYKKFRRNLWKRAIITFIILVILIYMYYNQIQNSFAKQNINSGWFLLLSIFVLFFSFALISVLIALMVLSARLGLDNGFDKYTTSKASLVTSFIVFLGFYFIFYEDTIINLMFTLDMANQYKVKSILEMIRDILVFSSSALVFTMMKDHLKLLISNNKTNKKDNKERKKYKRYYSPSKKHRN